MPHSAHHHRFNIGLLWTCLSYSALGWSHGAPDCVGLFRLHLGGTRILSAEIIAGPSFRPPDSEAGQLLGGAEVLKDLPAFCRVSAVVEPAITFELWLPLEHWNGKFLGTGNGGYNGSIIYDALATGLRRQYATASTDMGHAATSPDPGSWAMGHPELVVDQGYRAQHETAVRSKQLIRAFYGKKSQRSYFTGCSSGGWQALTEAQRFPSDYDGIVAGAPAINVIHLHAATLWNHQAQLQIAPAKYRLVTDAVLAQCDATDGVRDGLLNDPVNCHFVPQSLACKAGASTDTCLTAGEVTAMQHIYDGVHDASGEPIYPGWAPGVEYGLPLMQQWGVHLLAASTFKDMAFQDPTWDLDHIDFDADVRRADAAIGAIVNSNSPNLRAFRRHGGKLILYHGWNDPGISALNTVRYYQQVATTVADRRTSATTALADVQTFARLYLVPGMEHCAGGPGPDAFDTLDALENWVEHSVAPDRIAASHLINGAVDRTRPLCPYPQLAQYLGRGSTDDATSFVCAAPR